MKTPPSDLETSGDVTFLFEQAPDRNRQAAPTDQLILLDIEIYSHGETTPGKHIRRVLWSRRLINRQAMLSLTASVALCEVPGTTCELSINSHIWPEEDTANRHVLHGDFIRLRIDAASPSDELHMALCEQESADAQRYVYGRSPSRSPTPSDSLQPDEEDEPSEEAASLSLFQISAVVTSTTKIRKQQGDNRPRDILQDVTNVIGTDTHKVSVDPHVTDRWCGGWRPSAVSISDDIVDCLSVPASIVLLLEELLPQQDVEVLVVLWHIPWDPQFPSVVLLHPHPAEDEVQQELTHWGFEEIVTRLPSDVQADFIVVRPDIYKNASETCYVYLDPAQNSFMAYQTSHMALSDIQHMQFLESLELPRAVITSTRWLSDRLCLLSFHPGGFGRLSEDNTENPSTSLPDRLPRRIPATFSEQFTWCSEDPGNFVARLPFDCRQLGSIFDTEKDILMTHLEDLQISEESKHYVGTVTDLFEIQQADRLLIYVDGSSDPKHRHHHPEFAEHFGDTDAWSFVVLGERYDTGQISFYGWTSQKICYDQAADWYSGVTRLGADIAEREALIWAAIWRLQLNSTIPTTFYYDCVAARRFASGQQGAQEITGSTLFYVDYTRPYTVRLGMVFSPTTMSKDTVPVYGMTLPMQQRNSVCDKSDSTKDKLLISANGLLSSLIYGSSLDTGLASLHYTLMVWQSHHLTYPARGDRFGLPCHLSLGVASANVLTLGGGDTGFVGKTHYLQDQFASYGFAIVGIQEARSKEGMIVGKGPYYRLCSGHQSGHHGVELWISKSQPVGFVGHRPVLVNRSDVTVLWKDPRRLLVHIETEILAFYVAVLHCPQSGQDTESRESWWLETTELLSLHSDPMKLILLGDFNATSGPSDGVVVFETDDMASPNTGHFRASLEALQLCLPATTLSHAGPFHTWTSPDGNIDKRIDFIAIPQNFGPYVTTSATLEDVDLGNGAHDHSAIGLHLDRALQTQPVLRRRKRPSIDRTAIKHIAGNLVCSALDTTSTSNWQQDIETDVTQFNASALNLLTKHCRPPAPEAKKPFFDDELWNLRAEKNSCRRVLKRVCMVYRSEVLRTYFQAWTQSRRYVDPHGSQYFPHVHEHWNYRVTLQCDALVAAGRFYNKNFHTKKNLRFAKKMHIQKYVEQLHPGASAADILAGLRPCIGTSNMRKRKGTSLPHVLDEQGRPCKTQEDTVNRWSAFFCDMEGGTKMDLTQQRQLWLEGLTKELPKALDVPLEEMPTLLELEQSLRRVKDGKATGHDDIPSEFCHHHPGPVARGIFLQVWKLFLHGQEALVHKGGQLVAAYKRGSRGECSSYRSLLISTHLGKSHPSDAAPEADDNLHWVHAASTTGWETQNFSVNGMPHLQGVPKVAEGSRSKFWLFVSRSY